MKNKLLTLLFLLCLSANVFAAAPDLSTGSVFAFPGQTVIVPVTADYASATAGDMQVILTYDPNLLTLNSVTLGAANPTWTIVSNTNTPGIAKIAMYNPAGTTINGVSQQLALANFTVNATPGVTTLASPNLDLSAALLGNTTITSLTNGNFSLGIYGDLNGDGKVTVADAAIVAQYVIGQVALTPAQIQAAQGTTTNSVTIYNAFLIAEESIGLINKF